MNTTIQQRKFKDDSRFIRWVNDMDEKDKTLSIRRRRQKWIIITGGIFVLFVLSFLLFPAANPDNSKISNPNIKAENQSVEPAAQSAFDLPVDSFENHVKSIVHEELSEKK